MSRLEVNRWGVVSFPDGAKELYSLLDLHRVRFDQRKTLSRQQRLSNEDEQIGSKQMREWLRFQMERKNEGARWSARMKEGVGCQLYSLLDLHRVRFE